MRIDSTAFQASIHKAQAELDTSLTAAVKRSAELAAAFARVTTLYRNRTGKLRSSIGSQSTGRYSARTFATAKHAGWIEEGTKAHPIRARRARYLRFVQNGAVRFARSVFHPGTAPRPFMRQARDKTEPLFDRLVREAFAKTFT